MTNILRPSRRFCKVNSSQKDFPDFAVPPGRASKPAQICPPMKDNPKNREI